MSATRPIWNDGQGLATPDLQRGEDVAASMDERVHEVYMAPGTIPKRIAPLTEELFTLTPGPGTGSPILISQNPLTYLAVPSQGTLAVGVAGGVSTYPFAAIAGDISGSVGSSQKISLTGTAYVPLNTTAITSNVSGVTRYDLVYATLNRAVTVTGARKIKSAVDGTISSPTVNLADAPSMTLGIVPGFLTGGTPPTLTQIYAALPADTAPGATAGTFNFPICYVTVANGYTSGTILSINSAAGTTYITQCWPKDWHQQSLVRATRPMAIYYSTANEKPTSPGITGGTHYAERWGSDIRFFGHMKMLTTSSGINIVGNLGTTIDNTINWQKRFIWGWYAYLGSAAAAIENSNVMLGVAPQFSGANLFSGVIAPLWTGDGTGAASITYVYAAVGNNRFDLGVTADGALRIGKNTAPIDAANGDYLVFYIQATDKVVVGG